MSNIVLFIIKNTFFMALLFTGSAIAASSGIHYEAVIDAGSSGTRLYLYKVTVPVTPETMRKVEPIFTNIKGDLGDTGIDDYVCTPGTSPNKVNTSVITPLLNHLQINLPAGVKATQVTVNLLATAGMRTAEKNCTKLQVKHLYTLIKNLIRSRHFILGDVRTTDGNTEEGVWTWLNLNYFKDRLKTGDTTYGDLEVGGSSTQVVFATTFTQAVPANNIYAVTFNGKTWYVFSKSYLGLGQDDARKYIRFSATNPQVCWARGFIKANDAGEDDVSILKLPLDGDYNYASCTSLYDAYLAQKITENNGPPPINLSVGSFIGLDGAYYAASYFDPMPSDDPSFLTTEIPLRCVDVLLNPGIQDPTNKDTQRLCPNGTYVNAMMFGTSGLFRTGSNKVTLTISNDVFYAAGKVREITWTRGYLLLKKFI